MKSQPDYSTYIDRTPDVDALVALQGGKIYIDIGECVLRMAPEEAERIAREILDMLANHKA